MLKSTEAHDVLEHLWLQREDEIMRLKGLIQFAGHSSI